MKLQGLKLQGTHLKTQMLRVDADYAAALKREADAAGIKVTEYTRHLFESEVVAGIIKKSQSFAIKKAKQG